MRAPGESTPVPQGGITKDCLFALSLFFLALLCFLPALNNGFVSYDDPVYVTDNPHVRLGVTWAGVWWAFTSFHGANWHPLTWLSHMMDCQVYGLIRPWGHHLTSVLIHSTNAALLFLLLRKMTGALWRSFLVAMFFAVHPLRVESVAWVAERKDALSALFWMLTIYAYAAWVTNTGANGGRKMWRYWLALGLFILGLMSKPMIVTLPFVLLLLDYWPLGRIGGAAFDIPHGRTLQGGGGSGEPALQVVIEKIPFFLLAGAASVVTVFAQRGGGAMELDASLPFTWRVENALVAYCRYLGKLFYPSNLAVLYPHPGGWPLWEVIAAATLLVGISTVACLHRDRAVFTGWFWFVGTLAPVIGLIQVGSQSMADRYTYLPSIGILIAVVWGGWDLVHRWVRPSTAVSVDLRGGDSFDRDHTMANPCLEGWRDPVSPFPRGHGG